MGELAASGGYWITTIGRPIFAEPGTITGSIGVFSMRYADGGADAAPRRAHRDDRDSTTAPPGTRPTGRGATAPGRACRASSTTSTTASSPTSRRRAGSTPRPSTASAAAACGPGRRRSSTSWSTALGGLDDALAMVKKAVGRRRRHRGRATCRSRAASPTRCSSTMFEGSVLAGARGKLGMLLQQFGRIDVLVDAAAAGGGGRHQRQGLGDAAGRPARAVVPAR